MLAAVPCDLWKSFLEITDSLFLNHFALFLIPDNFLKEVSLNK